MDVFSLREQLIKDYSEFARSFMSIRAQDIKSELDVTYVDGRYWPKPLIQINPRYRSGRSTKQLAEAGELLGTTASLFPIDLYTHQEQSLALQPVRSAIADALQRSEVAAEATQKAITVLAMVENHLTPDKAPWFTDAASHARAVIDQAWLAFEHAFTRWRDLFTSAERQKQLAQATLDNYAITDKREREDAKRRLRQAHDQIDLLLHGRDSFSSDFYTYRYLATEGFLPGYNFPRLPLMASKRARQPWCAR